MAIKIDIDTNVFEVRKETRELEKEYTKLTESIDKLTSKAIEQNGLNQEQSKELRELKSNLKEVNKELNHNYKVINEIDPKNFTASYKDLNGEIPTLNKQMIELRRNLQLMAERGEENSQEFLEMSERLGEMRNKSQEAAMAVSILTAQQQGISGLRNNVKNLGKSVLSLDFNNASRSMVAMNATMKNLNFKKLSGDVINFGKVGLKSLMGGLKSATKAMWQFTTALLANPIVLIVIAVVAFVAQIYLLLKVFGLLDPVLDGIKAGFEAIMKPIKMLIQGFKDLTDWLGFTNHEEKRLADERLDRAEKEKESIEMMTTVKNNQLNREIELLKMTSQNTEEEILLIAEKTKEVIKNNIKEMNSDKEVAMAKIAKLKAQGKLTDEEKQQLKDLEKTVFETNESLKNLYHNLATEDIKTSQKIAETREKDEKSANEKIQKAREDHRKKMEENGRLRLEAEKFLAEMEEELRLKAIEDEIDREYEKNKRKLEKEMESVLSNAQLKNEERIKIEKYYDGLIEEENKKRNEKKEENELKAQKEINDRLFNLNQDELFKSKSLLDDKLKEDLEAIETAYKNGLISKEEYDQGKLDAEAEYRERLKELNNVSPTLEGSTTDEINEQYRLKAEAYKVLLDNEIISYEEYLKNMKELQENYAVEERRIDKETKDAKIKGIQDGLDITKSFHEATANLMNAIFENEISNAEEGSEKQEEIRKKQFKANKAMQLVTAAINTAQGIVAATAAGFPMMIPGIALAAITGATSIATIAAQKYNPSSSSRPSTPSTPNINSSSITKAMPDVSFQGTGGSHNEVTSPQNINNQVNVQTQVSVSETEITSTQNEVKKMEEWSSL